MEVEAKVSENTNMENMPMRVSTSSEYILLFPYAGGGGAGFYRFIFTGNSSQAISSADPIQRQTIQHYLSVFYDWSIEGVCPCLSLSVDMRFITQIRLDLKMKYLS